ncbi:MAG TPA: zonular occludens toxin domain-containing protein [Solirubrobacteraceae bacterium]|nr:zonular occludens toxin domain-containing protein [Solirubrobacteraceae bacterium]
MIELITGAPGSGKSYFSVRLIVRSVLAGRVVVTNVPMRDDWALTLAKQGWHKWKSDQHVEERRKRFESLVFVSDDLDEILRVRVQGDGEGRADMVLDECHRWLNSRMWDSGIGMSKDEATRARLKLVAFFSAHRHYGYNVYLITQNLENIDKQIRTLFEYRVSLKNLRRVKVLGMPLFPVNVFVALRFWNDTAKTKISVSSFGLDKSIANLYSTHALAAVDHPEDAIWMPGHNEAPGGPDGRAHGAQAPPHVPPAPSRPQAARPPLPPPGVPQP